MKFVQLNELSWPEDAQLKVPSPRSDSGVGEGDREAVEGAATRAMFGVAPSVSHGLTSVRSAPTLLLAPPAARRAVRGIF